ncbi:MAG: CPBP family glutamic-type intramembrane protease, partial [Anaerolineae bacterium]
MIRGLFWNENEQRVRFGWRIIGQLLLWLIFTGLATSLLVPEAGQLVQGGSMSFSAAPVFFRVSLASLVGYVISIWLAGRFLDRRPFAEFGLRLGRAWWTDFAFGLALGASMIAVIFLIEWAAGWVTITETFRAAGDLSFGGAFLLALGAFACIGIYEELAFRGYYLTNTAEWLGGFGAVSHRGAVVVATVITAVIFGVLHAANPDATLVSTFNIVITGAWFLAIGYVLTGSLAIPIGLHIAWNFVQGNVFGFPVSGIGANATTVIAVEQSGPAWVTGGEFGPEAGVLGLAATLVGGALVVLWVRWREGRAGVCEAIAE